MKTSAAVASPKHSQHKLIIILDDSKTIIEVFYICCDTPSQH